VPYGACSDPPPPCSPADNASEEPSAAFRLEVKTSGDVASTFYSQKVYDVEELSEAILTEARSVLERTEGEADLQSAVMACKKVNDLLNDVELIYQFVDLNQTALYKILKKFDKKNKVAPMSRDEHLQQYHDILHLFCDSHGDRLEKVR